MRWRREDGVWSTPGNFIDLAHEVGLTNEITRLVFAEAIASLDAVNQAFGTEPRLGFNIAARQACDGRFMRGFLETLAASGHARRFVLEITEEAFLPASQFQSRILPLIREIGAGLSIDDFGAGYSSLATLADITADEVKVDRSLITDIDRRPRSQSLIRAIESIGEALSMEVIVEGVETVEEFRWIRDHSRIRVAQGYYFAKPLMLTGVEEGVEWRASPKRRALSERYGRGKEARGGG
jgi:EAL domain-containing protein (putative c-di-GMP-specific phosphodiesterase class I)